MKRKILFLSLLVICFAILASGSLAYFTASDTAHNIITTGKIDIRLDEWADVDMSVPFEDAANVMPGAKVTKIVTATNIGTADAWVRVKVDKIILLAEGVTEKPDLSLLHIDYNTVMWKQMADGYWYYTVPLTPGESTVPLFTTVYFDTAMGNMYQNSTALVDVSVQAVQTANNGTVFTEAAGWPE